MLEWLKRRFSADYRREVEAEERQLRQLMKSLDGTVEDLPIDALLPILVPASFFDEGNWPGPHEILMASDFGMTWAVLLPDQTMRYVDRGLAAGWNDRGIDWQTVAMANLLRLSADKPWTHEFRRDDDNSLFAIGMLHDDGIGPSRLLDRERLRATFPEGYLISAPEMSVGIVCSARLVAAERDKVAEWSAACFRDGTRPLVEGFFDPEMLAISLQA